MRFSALFQQPVPRPPADDVPAWVATAPGAPTLPLELPDDLDLDARVRLTGEWQLLEG